MSLFKSEYYDKPEGEDYVGKMVATNRLALQGGLGIGKKDSSTRVQYTIRPAVHHQLNFSF